MWLDLIKENGFTLKKARSRRYHTQVFTDADYADDIVLLANAPIQAKYLLHDLRQAAGCIGPDVNADKTEYTCFNQKRNTTTLHNGSLKSTDKFTYLGSSVSSTENDVNMRLEKA